jgi:flagellar protein FlaJ
MGGAYKFYRRFSVALFGSVYERTSQYFDTLKPQLLSTNSDMQVKTWVCVAIMTTVIVFFASLVATALIFALMEFEAVIVLMVASLAPILTAVITFFVFYIYPVQKASNMRNSIETDLPFALAHMNAIASSGIPPEFMFDMLTDFEEYGAIAEQAKLIVRNIRTFGMSSINAINDVAKRTPSDAFKQVLGGMTSTIEKGGDMVDFINQMTEKAMFDYRIRREKYLKTLSTYADIYTALLVAAPLMMLSVLGIMSLIGGTILGLSIDELVLLMTWLVLPALNIAFIAFVHVTYPGV